MTRPRGPGGVLRFRASSRPRADTPRAPRTDMTSRGHRLQAPALRGRCIPRMRRPLLVLSLAVSAIAPAASAHAALPLPAGWPHHLALGVGDQPGDAQGLRRDAPFDARYQYLAGGVNTGGGWAKWNAGASFASRYVNEAIAAHMVPVLTYYQLLQSRPAAGSDELHKDLSNLRNPATVAAYWADWS